jgi:hypothetical protein
MLLIGSKKQAPTLGIEETRIIRIGEMKIVFCVASGKGDAALSIS